MNPPITRKHIPRILATSVAALLGFAAAAMGDSAIWSGPGTDWTVDANWNGTPYPKLLTEVATFDNTGTSLNPTITGTTITVGEVSFSAGAPVYTVTLDGAAGTTGLTIGAAGVTNGATQKFVATGNTGGGFTSTFLFTNSATAGTNTVWTLNDGGVLQFNDTTTAGSAAVTIQSGGKMFFTGTSAGGTAGIVNNAGGVFDISGQTGGVTVGSIAGAGDFFLGGNTLTTGSSNTDTAVSGVIQDGGTAGGTLGSLIKNGTGTLTLSGTNTYTGNTTLNNGRLFLNNGSALGTGALVITSAGGATTLGTNVEGTTITNNLSVQGDFSVSLGSSVSNLFLNGAVDLNGATRTITGLPASSQIRFGGAISNGGVTFATPFTATGSYVAFILDSTNVNTYTGLTTVGNGAFLVFQGASTDGAIQGDVLIEGNGVVDYLGGSANQIADTATVTVNSTGNSANGLAFAGLEFKAQTGDTIGALYGTGTVGLGAGTLTVGAGSFSGVIGDGSLGGTGGNLTKIGAGTLTLSGKNTYTGLTSVNAGTLNLNTTGGNAISGNMLVNGGTVVLQQSNQISDARQVTVSSGSLDVATFNDTVGGVTLNGGSIVGTTGVLSSTTAFDVQTGSVAARLGGSAGLTKTTAGTVTLTGANTYTGATTVNGGTLIADSTTTPTVLSSSSALVLGNGTFQFIGSAGNARQLVLNGLTINAGTSVVDVSNTGTSTTLDLSGSGGAQGITRNGNGSVDFRASTGTFSMDAIVRTGQANNASGIIGTWATVNNGAAFAANDGTGKIIAVANTVNINALGPNQIMDGPTTNVVINAMGTAGPVPIASATTNINTLSQQFTTASIIDTSPGLLRFGVAGGILIGSGKADLTIGTAANSGNVSAGGGTTNVAGDLGLNNQSGNTLTINSAIVDNGTGVVSLSKVGSGLVILAGTNTYTGPTTISEGALSLTGLGSLADTGAVNLNGATSVFDLSGITAASETVGSLAGVAGSSVVLGAKNLTAGGNNATTTFGGVISGASGSFTKAGSGNLTFTAGNSYTGATTIAGGTLTLSGTGSVSGLSALSLTAAATTFDISGITSASQTIASLAGVADSNVNLGSKTLFVGDGTSTNFAGTIAGAGGSLFKTGAGVLTLAGANTYTGATTISNGTLALAGAGSLSNSTAVNLSGATGIFDIVSITAASETVGSLAGTAGSSVVLGSNNLNAGGTNATTTFDGVISGAGGSFTKAGSGNLTFTAANTYTGATTISGGTLTLLGAGSVAATSAVNLTGASTTFDITGITAANQTIGSLAGVAGSNVTMGSKTLIAGGDNSSTTFAGTIAGSGGGLAKEGTGTLTLTGNNSYTGATTINGGKVTLSIAGKLSPSTTLNITSATGTFDVSSITPATQAIASLTGVAGSSVVLGAKNLTIGSDNSSTTFAGALSGAGGSLTKVGSGTFTLTGASTYTGATTVNGGTLIADSTTTPTVLNSSSALVLTNSTFQFAGSAGNARQLVLNGLTINAGNSVVDVNNTGNTTTLDLSGSGGNQGITRNGNGSVDFRASTGTFSVDAIVRTGQANNASGIIGTWATVNNGAAFAANDGTGKIVAVGNTVNIDALGPNPIVDGANTNVVINAMGTAGPVPIGSPTTNINTLSQQFTTASIIDTSPGLLRFGVAGGILIGAGKAALTIGMAPNSGNVSAGGGTTNVAGDLGLNNQSTNTLTINSAIVDNGTGVVSVSKIGSGLVILAGTNTYTGPTTISEGTLSLTGAGSLADTGAVNLNGATAIFDLSGITAASETVGSLEGVAGSSVVLGAKNLTAGGNNSTKTFNGVISGSGGSFTKAGSGNLTLTGANSYTGATTISGGTLTLSGAGSLDVASALNLTAASTKFDISGITSAGQTIASLTGVALSTVTLGSKTLTVGDSSSTTFAGIIAGSGGGLAKIGAGTLTLTGANTYTGTTTISGGTIALSAAGSLSDSTAVNLSVATGIFDISGITAASETVGSLAGIAGSSVVLGAKNLTAGGTNDTTNFDGVISGAGGSFTKAGSGNLTLTAAQTYTGATTISAGVITLSGAGSVAPTSAVNLSGSTSGLDISTISAASETIGSLAGIAGSAVSLGTKTLIAGGDNTSTTFAGTLFGTGGGLTKEGTGNLTLTGTNSYTGATTINAGKLTLSAAGSLGPSTAVTITSATGIFDLSGITATTQTIGSLASAVAGSSVVLGAKNLTVGGDNSSTTFAGVLSGASGSLTKVGTGTMTLTGPNTYTGATTVNAGTLVADLSTSPTVLSGSSALSMGGSTFQLRGTTGDSVQMLNGLTLTAGQNVIDVANTGTSTKLYLWGPSGTQGITRMGNASVDFRASAGTFGTDAIVFTGQQNVGGIIGAWATVNNGASLAANDGTGKIVAFNNFVDIAARGPTSVIPNDVTANVRINSPGTSGPITLAATTTNINTLSQNTTTDATVDTAGKLLRVGVAGGLFIATGQANLTIGTAPNSGTLTAGGDATDVPGELTLNNRSAVGTLTINSAITNNGTGVVSVTKVGAGAATFAGTNTYTGLTTIAEGTLNLVGAGSLADTGAVNLTGATAVFDISGITATSETIGSLAGVTGSSVALGAKNLTVSSDTASTTFSGIISGAGTLTKSGAGTLKLAGTNTYAGGTTLSGGTLYVNDNNGVDNINRALGTGLLTITGGTLATDVVLTGFQTPGGVGNDQAGTNLPNNISLQGNFSIATASVPAAPANQNFTLSGNIDLNNGVRTMTGLTDQGQIHFTGVISNGGLTVQVGPAVGNYVAFILDGMTANTYTGLTTVGAGAFLVVGNTVLNGAIQGDVVVNAGGSLDYFRSDQVADSATVTVNSTGLNVGNQHFQGLELQQNHETINTLLGTGTVGLSSGTLTVSQGNFSGVISDGELGNGTGNVLNKVSSGTLTLSGQSTYTGATNITGGTLALVGAADLLGSIVTITSPGILDISGATNVVTIGGLQSTDAAASVVLGAKILDVGSNSNPASFAGVISGTGNLSKVGSGTQTLTGVNTYTGATTVFAGTLSIDATAHPVLNSASGLVVQGGIFQLIGTSGATVQVMSGLTVNAGAGSIDVRNTGAGTTKLDLRGPGGTLGITHNAGGSVDFHASMGTFSTDAIVLTNQANDPSGIIGAWATVNNGADLAANDGAGKIIAFTGYTQIAARGPASVIPNVSTANVRITTPGTSGPVTLAAPVTVINTLSQNTTTASVVDTGGGTLKLGVAGGISITSNNGGTNASLTIGAAPNSGIVTAGGSATDTAGDLVLGNFSTVGTLTINSAITNNGKGVVTVSKTGKGALVLAGTNTYTGATTIGAGSLALTGLGSIADTSAVNMTGTNTTFDISGINATGETIGSLNAVSGTSVVLGAKTLTAGGDGSDTIFAGVMSGTGGFTKVGAGTMAFNNANTYTGLTTVTGGTLSLNAASGSNAINGDLLVNGGNVVLQQTSEIVDTANVTVSSGSLNIGANSELVNGVKLTGGSIDGTTGVLFSKTTFDVEEGTITANLSSSDAAVGLNKTTSGTVILAGQNTYQGATNVSGGVLILDGIINFGTNGVNVTNGSEFDVTGNGVVVVRDGVTVVTATDGNSINNFGLLQGGNNSIGIIAGNNNTINNSGSIVGGAVGFKGISVTGQGNLVSNAGFISGDKGVVVTNGAGANTVVNYGTLQGNSGTAIDSTTSGGNLSVINDGEMNGNVSFGSGDDTMTLVTGHMVNGLINGGTGSNLLRLIGSFSDTLDLSSNYQTNFSTLYKGGGGTWTLKGEGAFPGGTTVNMGTLSVQGNLISNVLVEMMGTLAGIGTITGNVTNFGTVSPGNSPGTMTVTGDYDQRRTGNLVIQMGGKKAGQSDLLKVGGKALLSGTVTIEPARHTPQFKLGEKITFLTADGGVNGKFSKVVNTLTSNTIIKTTVTYESNAVSLEGVQGSFEEYARLQNLTPNQRATSRVVDAAVVAGRNPKMVDYLNTQPLTKIPGDLDRIAPEELASVYRVGIGLATVQTTNIQRRTDDLRLSNRRVNTDGFQANGANPGFSGQLGATGEPGAEAQPVQPGQPARPPDQRWGAFLSGMGEWIRIGDTENARGYDFSTGGVTVGVDYRATDHFAVGASAGYAGTGATLAQGGTMRVNSGKVGVYATYFDRGFYADAAVSGGINNYDTRRSGLEGTARGKTDGAEVNAMLGGGYDWSLEALTLGALTSVEYTYLGLDGFTEAGSLAPLSIAGQHGQSLRSKLGFKAVYDWQLGGVLLRPELRAVWQHEYGDRSFALDSQLASGAGGIFTVHDSEVSRDSLLLGLGASMIWSPRTATYLFYDGEIFRKESESHNVTGGVRISF